MEIKKNIVIDASAEAVFKAITYPKELTNWFPDQAILEPKVGGKMKFGFYKKAEEESVGTERTKIRNSIDGTTIYITKKFLAIGVKAGSRSTEGAM